jgi:hypothetical protein
MSNLIENDALEWWSHSHETTRKTPAPTRKKRILPPSICGHPAAGPPKLYWVLETTYARAFALERSLGDQVRIGRRR